MGKVGCDHVRRSRAAEAGAGGGDGAIVITGDHYGFVFDKMTYPTTNQEARDVAFDVDGDGAVDNAFGEAMATLAVQGFDLNGALNTAVLNGQVLMLGDLQASPLGNSEGVGFSTYLGADPLPAPGLAMPSGVRAAIVKVPPCSAVNDCGHHLNGTAWWSDLHRRPRREWPGPIATDVA